MDSIRGLSKTEIFFLIVHTQVGFGMLNLPNKLQETSKSDGWISIILAGICIQSILFFHWLLIRRFPNSDFYEITRVVFGKYLGKLCNMATYTYFIITSTFVLLVSSMLIQEILLVYTPYWAIGVLIFTMCIYLCTSSIHVLARILTVLSVLILFLIILSFFSFSLELDIRNVLPVRRSGIKNMIFGTKDSLISLFGFEIILFLYPLAAEKNKAFLKNISFINLTVIGITVYFTIIAMMVFNNNLISQVKYPIVYMFRTLEFATLDRIDQIFFSIWAIPMVGSVSIYIFFGSKILKNGKTHKLFPVLITGILVFMLFLFAEKSDVMIEHYAKIVTLFGCFITFILPLMLLLTSIVLRIKGEEKTI